MIRTKRGRKPATGATARAASRPAKGRSRKGRASAEPAQPIAPPAPKDLGPVAAEYWSDLAPQLVAMGILRPLHYHTFRTLCECWQEYRQLSDWLLEDPTRMTFETEKGYICESPQLRQRDKALTSMYRLWMKFGLTPHALAMLQKQRGVRAGDIPAIEQFARKKYDDDA